MASRIPFSSGLQEGAAQNWWLMLLWGIAAVILGFFLVFVPRITALVLVQIMAAFWLVGGILDIVAGLFGRGILRRRVRLICGVISAIAGLLLLGNPLLGTVLTLTVQAYVISFTAITNGLANVIGGHRSQRSWGQFFLGATQIIIGMFLLLQPFTGILALIPILGGIVLVGGALICWLAVKSRRPALEIA